MTEHRTPRVLRLHVPAVPHVLTVKASSHCAFSEKTRKLCRMMSSVRCADGSRAYEVWFYGVEGADVVADHVEALLTRAEWAALRAASFAELYPGRDPAEAEDPTAFVGSLANVGTPLYREFNRRLRAALSVHFRGGATDLFLMPMGPAHEDAIAGTAIQGIESGIGYDNAYKPLRVYESFAWYHHYLGKEKTAGRNYHFVVPNYFEVEEWPFSACAACARARDVAASSTGGAALPGCRGGPECPNAGKKKRVGFLGRVCEIKGLAIVKEVALRFPDVDFVVCGQGDPRPFLDAAAAPNLRYEPPLHGEARGRFMGGLDAFLAPTVYVEPFLGAVVEAQLCGVPALSHAYGAPTETVEHGRTGYLCHTLGDFMAGVRKALAGGFDRSYVRERAVARYSLDAVGRQYHGVFRTCADLLGGKGWLTEESHLPDDAAV